MSSLIFHTSETDIILAMDTLAVDGADFVPLLFTTKFYVVPHLNGVICGTGVGPLITDWFVRVNTGMVVSDFLQLDHHTPQALRDIACTSKYSEVSFGTSTVYHLGFPADDGPPCVFAYRSEKDFVSDRLPIGGTAVKPMCSVPAPFEFPKDFVEMMHDQRRIQDALPEAERVFIGGDILVCHITRSGTAIFRIGSFPDKGSDFRFMCSQLP